MTSIWRLFFLLYQLEVAPQYILWSLVFSRSLYFFKSSHLIRSSSSFSAFHGYSFTSFRSEFNPKFSSVSNHFSIKGFLRVYVSDPCKAMRQILRLFTFYSLSNVFVSSLFFLLSNIVCTVVYFLWSLYCLSVILWIEFVFYFFIESIFDFLVNGALFS